MSMRRCRPMAVGIFLCLLTATAVGQNEGPAKWSPPAAGSETDPIVSGVILLDVQLRTLRKCPGAILAGLSSNGSAVLESDSLAVVVVDANGRWYYRYHNSKLIESATGEAGDAEALKKAIKSPPYEHLLPKP